jgi:phosphatidylserine/phosphatidylglycerophosphate/cardiolipin synthase-like enzyme
MRIHKYWFQAAALVLALAPAVPAVAQSSTLQARGTVQVAFSPWDDAEGLVVGAIRQAKKQILVQAYSFTSRTIANALIAARRRGVEVRVIADSEQAQTNEGTRIAELVAAGVTVLLDSGFQSAHSKVMLIDSGEDHPAVLTGSYNWTYAAQYRNAENLLILKDHPELARAYRDNWERHAARATPFDPAP